MRGGLTDYGRFPLSVVDMWVDKIGPLNALFAEQLRDIRPVLDAYDGYLNGFVSSEKLTAVWTRYSAKWLDIDPEHVRELMEAVLKEVADGIVNGYVGRKDLPSEEAEE